MRRRVPLLVLLYVTLDFANPLMPGAVRFEAGAVEVVEANQGGRVGTVTSPAPAVPPTTSAPTRVGEVARPAPVPPATRAHSLRVVRRPALERSSPLSSPTEDH